MTLSPDELDDLAAKLSRLSPEQLDAIKDRTTPAAAKFAARAEPQTDSQALLATFDRALAKAIRDRFGVSEDADTPFKASTSRTPSRADGPERLADADESDDVDNLDDAEARRILREFLYGDVEVGAAARKALREFRQLQASRGGIHCTRMGPERFIKAHPEMLKAQGIASFAGR